MSTETESVEAGATVVRAEAPPGNLGETATVVRFFVEPGDRVETGAAVCRLRTKRFLYDLPAVASGIVETLLVAAGAETKVGAPLLRIVPPSPARAVEEHVAPAPRATPLARAIAAAHGLDLRQLAGTWRDGRIRATDVRDALGEASNNHAVAEGDRQPGMAPALIAGDERPFALTAVEVDQQTSEESSAARIVHAAAQALIEHPWLNSCWTAGGVLVYGRITLGLWRDTAEGRSLTLLPNAADLSLRGIERAMNTAGYVAGAPLEVAATFNMLISNTGWWSLPAVPPGSAALLHVGRVERRPVVLPATECLAIGSRRLLALIYDARYITQAEADSLLCDLRTRVERRAPL